MEAYKFYNASKGKTIYVAWLTSLLGSPLETSAHDSGKPGGGATCNGNVVTTLTDDNNDGQIEVPRTGNPSTSR
ncbi:MAG: hypothetical protein R2873_35485 [Caldilineaceae bacterium]